MFTLNPYSENFFDTLDFLLKLFGGLGGLYIFIIGLKRYTKDQAWKRHEFVANEFKEFNSDGIARNAMYMLDWGERSIQLFPQRGGYYEQFVMVDRKKLKDALQFHELRIKHVGKQRFDETEIAIRDSFDHFFSYFERYYQFIEAGLVTGEELKPYLNYWLVAISTEIEVDVRNVISHYIDRYQFVGTQKLFDKFGKDILPKTPIETTLN